MNARKLAITLGVLMAILIAMNEAHGQEDCGPLDVATLRDSYEYIGVDGAGTVGGVKTYLASIKAKDICTKPQQCILYFSLTPQFSLHGYAIMGSSGLEYYRYSFESSSHDFCFELVGIPEETELKLLAVFRESFGLEVI